MVSLTPRPASVLFLGALLCSLGPASALPKSSDKGIEFVKACDSGTDDVTNQCINRIPEDIGMNTGNHACAYHEAEVRCLGLCGNTITWKVAYNNALKRYRLVCAGYIEERLTEKADEGEGGDANADKSSSSSQKSKKRPSEGGDSDSSGDSSLQKGSDKSSDAEGDQSSSKKQQQQTQASKSSRAGSESPQSSKTTARSSQARSSSSATASAQKDKSKQSPTGTKDTASATGDIDEPKASAKQPKSNKPVGDADELEKEGRRVKDRAPAFLPTMDPEIAGSPHTTHALTAAGALAVLVAAIVAV